MSKFRVQIKEGDRWVNTFWGLAPEERPHENDDGPYPRLTAEAAKEGLKDAQKQYRDKEYRIIKLRERTT